MPLSLPPTIRAIVFDAYGTLLDVQNLDAFLARHFGAKATEINAIWRQKQLQYTWLRSLMGRYEPFSTVTADALRFACGAVGVELSEEVAAQLTHQYDRLQAFSEVPAILERLSQKIPLAVLSNANDEMLLQAVRFNGLEDSLAHVLSVNAIGKFKPMPEVYAIAENALGLDRSQIAFVSSNTWDVAGAASFGLNVIWLNRYGGQVEELGFSPNWIVSKLEEIQIS